MIRRSSIQPKATVAGRSLVLNSLMVTLTGLSLAFFFMANLPVYAEQKVLFYILATVFGGISIGGILLFKGRLALSNFARVIIGSVFIVSGLIKANDPIGFSYKLEEYFQDSALAFRIKEWFNIPEFSIEYLIPYALHFAVGICIVEIVLGVMMVLGQKMKAVAVLTLGLMLFFTFLTWHTANCSSETKFTDKEYYALNDTIALEKLHQSKSNPNIKVIRQKEKYLVEESKNAQCVEDCGCFGDALKSSLGRSLSPIESLWKDLILLYLAVWMLFGAFKKNRVPETEHRWFWITSLVLISVLSLLFGWFFPVLFSIFVFIGSLWFLRKENSTKTSGLYLTGFITLVSFSLVLYTLKYEPLIDFRPYAVGNNLKWKMSDGKEGVYQNFLVYKNIKNKKLKEFDAQTKEYNLSQIWKDKNWKFISSYQKVIRPTRLPSITDQFNPFVSIVNLTSSETSLDFVANKLKQSESSFLRLYNVNKDTVSLALNDQMVDSLIEQNYKILDTVRVKNENFQDVYIRQDILNKKSILILSVKKLDELDRSKVDQYKDLFTKAKKDNIPMIMLVSSSYNQFQNFRRKYSFDIPVFVIDETELKTIARSNSSLMVLKYGVVKGKYPKRTTPDYEWLKSNVLK